MKVGFIGLGRMGRGIAGRVLQGGHDLAVYNRTRDKAAELGKAGARIADSVALACADREVVITMLADDAALEAVARGEGGLLASLPGGTVHLAMGTHGVEAVRGLAPGAGPPPPGAPGRGGGAGAGPRTRAREPGARRRSGARPAGPRRGGAAWHRGRRPGRRGGPLPSAVRADRPPDLRRGR